MNQSLGRSGLSATLAALGIGVTSYLSYASYNTDALSCVIGDCGTVQSSDYARLGGIPIALLGLGMFLTVFTLVVLRAARPEFTEMTTFATFGILLASTGYYIYLTYIELFVIEAICQWCVISSLLTVGLLGIEGRRSAELLRE
jgi:uncharacterized membrane protein